MHTEGVATAQGPRSWRETVRGPGPGSLRAPPGGKTPAYERADEWRGHTGGPRRREERHPRGVQGEGAAYQWSRYTLTHKHKAHTYCTRILARPLAGQCLSLAGDGS